MRKGQKKDGQAVADNKETQLEKIANHIEKLRLGEYVDMMNRPGRIIYMNLLAGVSRGVGLTVGATLVIAVLFKILSVLIAMNIPYLTEMLQEVVQIIKSVPGGNAIAVPQEAVQGQPTEIVSPEVGVQ